MTELLGNAAGIYSQRIRRLEGERLGNVEAMHDETIEPIRTLRKAAASSNSFQGTSLVPSDNFFLPSSMEYYEGGSMQNERRQEGLIHLPNPGTSINAHGVLGQILFDVCVPKNVEGWDIRSSDSLNRRSFASTRRHNPFNPIKCIRRSRL